MKFLFILFTLFGLSANAQTSGKTLGGNYPSGFYGFRNYMLNPGGEIDAQNVSVSGTGGTIGVFSNNPITNKKSFRVGGNLSTNITATFTAAPFDQGLGDSANNCAAAFNLQPNGVGTYTMNVKLGSTTVATRSFTTTSGQPVQYIPFLFSCGAFGLTPTIDIIANLTSGSGTDHFQADDFYMGQDPGLVQSLRIATQEQPYTPTYTGFGTVSTSNMKWYQDGAYIYVYGSFVPGTTTAVEARVTLPTGYTAASTISTIMLCGDASRNSQSTTLFRYTTLCEPNVSYFTIGRQTSVNNSNTKALGTEVGASGDVILVNAKIPIQGASNVIGVPASCINNPDCANNFSAKVSLAGVVSDESYSFINGNAVVTSTSLFTITWDTARFSVAPNCTATTTVSGVNGIVRLQGQATTTGVAFFTTNQNGGSSTAQAIDFNITCSRAGTDVKPWGPIPWLTGMISNDLSTSQRNVTLEFAGAATASTTCTSNPCTVRNPSLAGLSVAWVSAGLQTVTFPANTWRSVDDYTCQASLTSFAGSNGPAITAVKASATSLTVTCTSGSGGVVNCAGVISCWGPR